MNKKEELDNEYSQLTMREVEIDNQLKTVEPSFSTSSTDKQTRPYFLSIESLKQYQKLNEQKQKIAERKQEIIEEISKISSNAGK